MIDKEDWGYRSKFYNNLDWVNRKVLLDIIVEIAGFLDHKWVLDVGTGTGKVLQALKKHNSKAHYCGIDINRDMLKKAEQLNNFYLDVQDVKNLKFERKKFDLVTARMVLHHVDDLGQAMSEIYRVLKPGGQFIFCEGNPPDYHCIPFYENIFRLKEDRNTFLLDDMVNLLIRQEFKDISSKTIMLKRMGLNNWLEESGLPISNVRKIKELHYNCKDFVWKAYNMKIKDDDLLMDWKFSIVWGFK
ncbi:MAG: class I SAM-dependent methyltransferase [Candidatus Heimdallarchaeaceae archaeon]